MEVAFNSPVERRSREDEGASNILVPDSLVTNIVATRLVVSMPSRYTFTGVSQKENLVCSISKDTARLPNSLTSQMTLEYWLSFVLDRR